MSSVNSFCTIILEYLVVRDVNIISAKLRCLHPTSVWLQLSEGWEASCPGWFILPPRQGFGSNSVISSFLLHHNLGLFSCKRCEHYFNQTEMFTSNICLVTLVLGVGGGASCPGWFILPPCLGFGSGSVISQFLLHHYLGIFSCKRYKHYFSQTEMFTSNIQFGYSCPRGEGQAVQAGLSCPHQGFGSNSVISSFLLPPRLGFGSGSVISQFLLHHNLGIFSCKRYKHYFIQTEMFTSNIGLVTLVLGVGGKLSRLVYLAPCQGFRSNSVISSFLLHHNLGIFSCNRSYRCEHYFSQTEMFTSNISLVTLVRGVGGKLSRLVYLAPA